MLFVQTAHRRVEGVLHFRQNAGLVALNRSQDAQKIVARQDLFDRGGVFGRQIGVLVQLGLEPLDLLEMLETNKVSIPRAVWFVRVVGAADTVGTSENQIFVSGSGSC